MEAALVVRRSLRRLASRCDCRRGARLRSVRPVRVYARRCRLDLHPARSVRVRGGARMRLLLLAGDRRRRSDAAVAGMRHRCGRVHDPGGFRARDARTRDERAANDRRRGPVGLERRREVGGPDDGVRRHGLHRDDRHGRRLLHARS